ncbi:hypothetical protein [Endozoicomonas arenosclerae]|uniref:hypothetical protein n=1 Tax=Endozoicomonas arenosclerae TaxID=1633495 RepID=UPI000AC26CE2|nr:hypothetical protein [Endozoicomonas arenosclerae]
MLPRSIIVVLLSIALLIAKAFGLPVMPHDQAHSIQPINEHYPKGQRPGHWKWVSHTQPVPKDADRTQDGTSFCLTYDDSSEAWLPGRIIEPKWSGSEHSVCLYFLNMQAQRVASFWVLMKLENNPLSIGWAHFFTDDLPEINLGQELCLHTSSYGKYTPGLTKLVGGQTVCESDQYYTDYSTLYFIRTSISTTLLGLSVITTKLVTLAMLALACSQRASRLPPIQLRYTL